MCLKRNRPVWVKPLRTFPTEIPGKQPNTTGSVEGLKKKSTVIAFSFSLYLGHTWLCAGLIPGSAQGLHSVVFGGPCAVPGVETESVYVRGK